MKGIVPITSGSLYEAFDEEPIRVRSVWVDEDSITQIKVFCDEKENEIGKPKHRQIPLEDFVSSIRDNELERINSDHEAWEWRNR